MSKPERAERLFYTGDGSRFFGALGVPGRDLTEEETAALSDAVYAEITGKQGDGEPALYQKSPPRGRDDAPPPSPVAPAAKQKED